jgi:hypothetical protein
LRNADFNPGLMPLAIGMIDDAERAIEESRRLACRSGSSWYRRRVTGNRMFERQGIRATLFAGGGKALHQTQQYQQHRRHIADGFRIGPPSFLRRSIRLKF